MKAIICFNLFNQFDVHGTLKLRVLFETWHDRLVLIGKDKMHLLICSIRVHQAKLKPQV